MIEGGGGEQFIATRKRRRKLCKYLGMNVADKENKLR